MLPTKSFLTAINVIFLLFICNVNSYYYVNPNLLRWSSAEYFCSSHCDSHLASIHNDNDQLNAFNILTYEDSIKLSTNLSHTSNSSWIGMNDINSTNDFSWTDGSVFNYTYWSGGQPSDIGNRPEVTQDCGVLWALRGYKWDDEYCDVKIRSLCNRCHLILNKYIIIDKEMNFTESKTFCNVEFGTNTASLHGYNDWKEVKLLCKETNIDKKNDCWLGLSRLDTQSNFIWNDGTTFDFKIWENNEPKNDLCVQLWGTGNNYGVNYNFDDTKCDTKQHFLCNKPSEIWECSKWKWMEYK